MHVRAYVCVCLSLRTYAREYVCISVQRYRGLSL